MASERGTVVRAHLASASMQSLVAVFAAGLALTACAAPPPMMVSDTVAATAPRAQPVGGCPILVTEVIDTRRARDTLGVVAGRAVKSPPNSEAWLRSVVTGLNARGFAVEFADQPQPGVMVASFSLQTAWVTDEATNMTANVVLRVRATREGATPLSRDYRGAVSRVNWATTDSELQHLIEASFGKALDPIASDLQALCPRP